ncbi:TPA: hypothetical protein ACH3X1_009492 [Trebouxia sp. C0004]
MTACDHTRVPTPSLCTKQLFASCAIFEAADGSIITTMHQRVYNAQCSNEFAWGPNTYRWGEIRGTVSLKLQLISVSTQEQVAHWRADCPPDIAKRDMTT